MKKSAIILWLVSLLSLGGLMAARFIYGGWTTDLMFIPLGTFLLAAIAAVGVDYKFYLEFLTLRTTKHGMNMGVLILLVLALLIGVNYFGARFSKTFDMTEEKLHSLADQTKDLLDGLKDEVNVIAFYRGEKDHVGKQQVTMAMSNYRDYSRNVKLRFVNSYVDLEMAGKYLKGQSDASKVVLFVEYGPKRIRVEEPYSEQNITSAMIKATRTGQKTIYFLTGHGERDINSDEEPGLAQFKKTLEDASFLVKQLNLFENPEVPGDADIVAVIGPKLQVVEGTRKALVDFAKKGGRLFIAADPGEKHQIRDLAKEFGVDYQNNFILDLGFNRLLGRGPAGIFGLSFDSTNEITKKFVGQQGYTVFEIAGEVKASESTPEGVSVKEIVKSAPTSFVVNELTNRVKPGKRASHSLAVLAEGEFKKAEGEKGEKSESFAAVFFGDSDFLAQKDIVYGLNTDLARNAIAYLAKETDLISIQPKAPKGTKLEITSMRANILRICGMAIPFVFLILSGVTWYRRRSA